MKGSRSQNNAQSKQGMSHKPKPEIRDNLDSRKEKEMTRASLSRDTGKKSKKENRDE
jgi:hypothetical protein